jgi:hypothetical protein
MIYTAAILLPQTTFRTSGCGTLFSAPRHPAAGPPALRQAGNVMPVWHGHEDLTPSVHGAPFVRAPRHGMPQVTKHRILFLTSENRVFPAPFPPSPPHFSVSKTFPEPAGSKVSWTR